MTMVTARVHTVQLMNADWAPGGRQPSDQANRLRLWVRTPAGCDRLHLPSPFIIITQPESWYSFYRPTKGEWLSRPRHCSKGVQHVPKAVYRTCLSWQTHNCPCWDSIMESLSRRSRARYHWTTATQVSYECGTKMGIHARSRTILAVQQPYRTRYRGSTVQTDWPANKNNYTTSISQRVDRSSDN